MVLVIIVAAHRMECFVVCHSLCFCRNGCRITPDWYTATVKYYWCFVTVLGRFPCISKGRMEIREAVVSRRRVGRTLRAGAIVQWAVVVACGAVPWQRFALLP